MLLKLLENMPRAHITVKVESSEYFQTFQEERNFLIFLHKQRKAFLKKYEVLIDAYVISIVPYPFEVEKLMS